jgi:AcrR family transcriptional regulator
MPVESKPSENSTTGTSPNATSLHPSESQDIACQAILPGVQLFATLVCVTETLGLRERKKLGTRWALSDAALELALERGLENVTREDIANKAGVSLRTFNNYFTGKYEAVAFRQVDRTRQSLAAFRERPADEPLWSAITEAMLQPLEAEGATDMRPTPDELAVIRELLSSRDLRAALTRDLFADWVDAIAERTGTDPARDMYPRLVTAVVRAIGETAIEAYSYADPPVPYTELLRRGFAEVAAGLPER